MGKKMDDRMIEVADDLVDDRNVLPLANFEEVLGRLKNVSSARSEKHLAEILGVRGQAVTSARKRGEIPTGWIIKIGHQFDISLDWIVYGKGPMRRGEERPRSREPFPTEDYYFVPLLESRVTAGPEGEILYEDIADYYPFKQWWIERLVGKRTERKRDLILIRVRGDSMSPTINQGEVALVDTYEGERIAVRSGHIYLVTMPEGHTAMKRLVVSKDQDRFKLVCLSDNTADYRPFEFEIEPERSLKAYVLGRVRWAGKEFD
jgi:phage repressor protein C with HTH and peptisase S24 domain